MRRTCWKCQRAHHWSRFPRHRHRRGATFVYGRSGACIDCHRADSQVTRQRRALGIEAAFPYAEWGRILDACDHRCAMCARRTVMHIDHVRPITAGGLLVIENLQPLCASCNSKKGGRPKGKKPTRPRPPAPQDRP